MLILGIKGLKFPYLRSGIVVSGDQIFSHLHYILETVFACVDFNFSVLMLFH